MVFWASLGKLVIVFILAGIYGFDRQRAHKPVGFGTFIFVSLGACALAITSIEISGENPLPLLSAIVTGIGFLGAGAMIKTSDKIFGVTTAASVWTFAVFGLLIGVGEILVGLALYAFIWIVIVIDSDLAKRGIGTYQRKAIITTSIHMEETVIKMTLTQTCKRFKLIEWSIDKKEGLITRHYILEGTQDVLVQLPIYLRKEKEFIKCTIE
jgi:putative Mg2+ transporter-C (MgtC) family protein